jgi:hypothetical protein
MALPALRLQAHELPAHELPAHELPAQAPDPAPEEALAEGKAARLARLRAVLASRDAAVHPDLLGSRTEPTGMAALDRAVGGWPWPGVAEVTGLLGSGRLAAVLPLLGRLSRGGQHVAVVDVLGRLYPPGLEGVWLPFLLVVRPGADRAVWATAQILGSGAVAATVLLDPIGIGAAAGHRLLHAAEEGRSLLVVVNEQSEPRLPASLRLQARGTREGRTRLRVLKCRKGREGLEIDLERHPEASPRA